jgi:hypothetical protein
MHHNMPQIEDCALSMLPAEVGYTHVVAMPWCWPSFLRPLDPNDRDMCLEYFLSCVSEMVIKVPSALRR